MADRHTTNDLEKLKELLDGIRFAMFTTFVDDRLRARPMTTLEADTSGSLWFLTSRDAELVEDIEGDDLVGLSYANDDDARYVSISGSAYLREDPARVEQLWNPILNAWFEGKDDPTIQLIEVRIEAAEYWDGQSNRLLRLAGIVGAAITGDHYDAGEQGAIELPAPADAGAGRDR